ncbi:baseplate J/gp47 family protein [Tardiphaga sp. vice304]|uniref:baseplate J/gp47 family protein n=1 Tax=Tardiphaga sp. vice304 TaxID=2592817 RepID=UPI001164FBDC|nr:baseplate J/gp47 family protein [Tardiphaga sp. vice304]QDM27007.1 baseplate J/gp47 family protein [Tardiphaga sp. vice304]
MFVLPTLKDLMERARQEFRTHLKGTDAYIWPNNLYATAKVLAGLTFEVMGFASYISRQKFAVTAPDIESLRLHGEEFGISQNPASPANGSVTVTALTAFSFDAGAKLSRADGGQYLTLGAGNLPEGGSITATVIAEADGSAGNASAGTDLVFVSGFTGDLADVIAQAGENGLTLGSDVEDIESYRARILFRKRNPPHGGSAADYVWWAGQVAGVSFYDDRPTVYVNRLWAGPGTVRVYPLMLDLYADGVPQTADILRVREFISQVQPAGASVSVAAPVRHPVNVTIGRLSPNTVPVREAVLAELRDLFRRRARVAGTDVPVANMPYLATPFAFSRSWIWQAIADASGEDAHELQWPIQDVVLAAGEIPVLGTVSFV